MGIFDIMAGKKDTSGDPKVTSLPETAGPRRTSQQGRKAIIEREGVVLKAYPDPNTGGAPWTIGVGHTGADVYPGKVITLDEAEMLLEQDLQRFEAAVRDGVSVPLSQNQFDALVSFAFNVGVGEEGNVHNPGFLGSTLRRKLNEGDYAGASAQFRKWVVPEMITGRRAGEWVQFNTPDGDAYPSRSRFDERFP